VRPQLASKEEREKRVERARAHLVTAQLALDLAKQTLEDAERDLKNE
jgi:hypothetical protein